MMVSKDPVSDRFLGCRYLEESLQLDPVMVKPVAIWFSSGYRRFYFIVSEDPFFKGIDHYHFYRAQAGLFFRTSFGLNVEHPNF